MQKIDDINLFVQKTVENEMKIFDADCENRFGLLWSFAGVEQIDCDQPIQDDDNVSTASPLVLLERNGYVSEDDDESLVIYLNDSFLDNQTGSFELSPSHEYDEAHNDISSSTEQFIKNNQNIEETIIDDFQNMKFGFEYIDEVDEKLNCYMNADSEDDNFDEMKDNTTFEQFFKFGIKKNHDWIKPKNILAQLKKQNKLKPKEIFNGLKRRCNINEIFN